MSTLKRFALTCVGGLLVAATLVMLNFAHAPTASAAFAQSCPAQQQQGNSGALVQVIQFRLNSLNEDGEIAHAHGNPFPLATDGSFGSLTNEAVLDFQSTEGLGVDGMVGPQTWGTMGFCTTAPAVTIATCCASSSLSHCPAAIAEGSSGTFVEALQQGLNVDANAGVIGKGSWFPLSVDGQFGAHTKAAVQSLQSAAGITQDGSVGPQTWGAFGMCY